MNGRQSGGPGLRAKAARRLFRADWWMEVLLPCAVGLGQSDTGVDSAQKGAFPSPSSSSVLQIAVGVGSSYDQFLFSVWLLLSTVFSLSTITAWFQAPLTHQRLLPVSSESV